MPRIVPKMLRPRHEFPTPLFKLTLPLLVGAVVAIVVWALVG